MVKLYSEVILTTHIGKFLDSFFVRTYPSWGLSGGGKKGGGSGGTRGCDAL